MLSIRWRLGTLVGMASMVGLAGGCGGSPSSSSMVTIEGTVLSYREADLATPGVVTEADLHPVGAGVPIHIVQYEVAGAVAGISDYYQTHPFPTTDANGHFTIFADRRNISGVVIYVADRCSTTVTNTSQRDYQHFFVSMGAGLFDQHLSSALLHQAGETAQDNSANAPVIVTSADVDACTALIGE